MTKLLHRFARAAALLPLLLSMQVHAAEDCKNHYILTSPAACKWVRTGDLHAARAGHTATLLDDGSVLVVGGVPTSEVARNGTVSRPGPGTVERYEPVSRTWRKVAPLHRGRTWHAAVQLADGRVLAVGGENFDTRVLPGGTAEIYDPEADAWTLTAPMNHRHMRWRPTLTLLADGKVLVAGGSDAWGNFGPPELYDAVLDRWERVGSDFDVHRYGHQASRLPGGRVLFTGGTADTWLEESLAESELFVPKAATFVPAPSALFRREWHTATELRDGNVLVAGGVESYFVGGVGYRQYFTLASSEMYDVHTAKWVRGHEMLAARQGHTATMVASGALVITGGLAAAGQVPRLTWEIASTAELRATPYDRPVAIAPMNDARMHHTATALRDGSLLVVGGQGAEGRALASAELFMAPANR